MSRVGKVPVKILQGIKVEIKDRVIKVDGPKGKLVHRLAEGVNAKVENGLIVIARDEKFPKSDALHGMTRTIIHNMVHGAHTGFSRDLDIVGVGYRASTKGNVLLMNLGFSHPVEYTLPQGITAKVENNTHVVVTGADKILVGMVAAKIRSFKKPEPYQGKGVKYTNEHIIRKQGKAAGAK
ncbi:MAG: 50S ribosomal protein L6 [Bdellovibrionales bacterium RIFOXYD1_FULL_44_7]|nr:MAG: 50S ribosomal protein L6 [Bdellovibrionales bacterium RIFOXYD1_FULL_44_7]